MTRGMHRWLAGLLCAILLCGVLAVGQESPAAAARLRWVPAGHGDSLAASSPRTTETKFFHHHAAILPASLWRPSAYRTESSYAKTLVFEHSSAVPHRPARAPPV